MRRLLVGVSLLALCACATGPTDPQQSVYAAKQDFAVALAVAAEYKALPDCSVAPTVVCKNSIVMDNIVKASDAANSALNSAEATVRDPAFASDSSTISKGVVAAQNAVSAFVAITSQLKVN